ncbi:MAG: hypothetical protein CL840_16325 [Crocinitomicaceae bacterium]|nr:hypothetical protein [Crocinitomicaceae bacterium]|tara:strand:+ start:1011 stop:1193 length:183 start_codon:yes stop_codon:yes gene_type:complete
MERFEQSRYRVEMGNSAAAILAALRTLTDTQNPIHVEIDQFGDKRVVTVIYENTNYKDSQ